MTEEQDAQVIEELPEEMTITEALEHIRQIAEDYADDHADDTTETKETEQ